VIGSGQLDLSAQEMFLQDILGLQGPQTKSLHYLADCLATNFPLLIVTDDC